MALAINGNVAIQKPDSCESVKPKQEIKTQQKAVTLSKDELKIGGVDRGFNGGGFGAFWGIAAGMGAAKLIGKSTEFGFLGGAAAGVIAGATASQTTKTWWKGALIGGAVGTASGAIIGAVSGKGAATGAIVGAAAGAVSGVWGSQAPNKLINL